jgi:hypothetical protein
VTALDTKQSAHGQVRFVHTSVPLHRDIADRCVVVQIRVAFERLDEALLRLAQFLVLQFQLHLVDAEFLD